MSYFCVPDTALSIYIVYLIQTACPQANLTMHGTLGCLQPIPARGVYLSTDLLLKLYVLSLALIWLTKSHIAVAKLYYRAVGPALGTKQKCYINATGCDNLLQF